MSRITDQIDLSLVPVITKITESQEARLPGRGAYIQYQPLHRATPEDGAARTPDGKDDLPNADGETWTTLAARTDVTLPEDVNLRLDAYHAPDGPGYILYLQVNIDRQLWQRAVQQGPETWRTSDWLIVPADL